FDVLGVVGDGAVDLAEVDAGVGEPEMVPLRRHLGVRGVHGVGDRLGLGDGGGAGERGGKDELLEHGRSPGSAGCGDQRMRAASSKGSRGERGNSWAGSPYPRLTSRLERIRVPAKNSASTFALSNPVIGPVSSPSARA